MKLQYIKASFLLVAGFSLTLTSCLKDKDFDNGMIQSVQGGKTKVISIASGVSDSYNFAELDYPNSSNDTVVDFLPVQLTNGNSPAPQDLHVTVALDPDAVTTYNGDNGTDFPLATVAIVNPVVTIPKGSYQGFLQVKFKPNDLVALDGAVGFKISGVQESGYTISGNLNTGVIYIHIYNAWEGAYTGKGSVTDTSVALTGAFSKAAVTLYTSGANSVDMIKGQPLINKGTLKTYPRLTIDPATNLLTVTNSASTPVYDPAASYTNKYDPASGTFYFQYGYSTGSGPILATDTVVLNQ